MPAAPTASGGTDAYTPVELVNLKLDRDKLLGRSVVTQGRLNILGQLVLLRTESVDNNPLPINLARLSSERQREIRARCTPQCRAYIAGKVGHVAFGIGLAAERIRVQAGEP